MTQQIDERSMIVDWFEGDFKESAKATTKTQRLEDGKLSYSFSVVNNSGFDFSRFSFRIKVINKADGSEIGAATIKAGKWAAGEKKNFRSRLSIPPNARSLSFVMYSNSLEYEASPSAELRSALNEGKDIVDEVGDAFRDVGDAVRNIGDALNGSDGSGGVFGELFGTGGMPGTTTTRTTTTRTVGGTTTTTTRTTTTTGGRGSGGTVNSGGKRTSSGYTGSNGSAGSSSYVRSQGGTYSQRRNQKKLNKKRLGKSGWTVAGVVVGILMIIASFADTNTAQQTMAYLASGGVCLAAAGISKLIMDSRAKRIRAYEARVNQNGNTSIDDLAAYVGKPYDKVADDLQKMIADGFFGEAYLDLDNRMLVMMRNGVPIEDVAKSAAANKKAKRKAAREKGVVPESLDDLITMTDDVEIKNKLKNLRAVTKKIDERVAEVPELEKQVTDFREKYYPEVVRLTDDYNEKIADMGNIGYDRPSGEVTRDASGAPVINTNPNYLSEQAADIKSQLISLIDSVTEASENLLEKLHEDDIMDITTDIKMLQTTLASKGLLDSDFVIKE